MNVIKIAEEGLKDKNWTQEEKAKYIYNLSCELFTYDSRYYYADKDFKKELKYRKIDLENVTDNRVVCSSHAREVCVPLLKLIGMNGKVIDEESHGKVLFSLNNEDYIMDAAAKLDFMRVKLKRNTLGFYPIYRRQEYTNPNNPQTKSIDKKINYIQDDYFDVKNEIHFEDHDDILSKMIQMKEFLRQHPEIISFNDASKTIDYLEQYLFQNYEFIKVTKIELFQDLNGNWDIKTVYMIEDRLRPACFILSEKGNTYTFDQVTEEEGKYQIKTHRGFNREALFR